MNFDVSKIAEFFKKEEVAVTEYKNDSGHVNNVEDTFLFEQKDGEWTFNETLKDKEGFTNSLFSTKEKAVTRDQLDTLYDAISKMDGEEGMSEEELQQFASFGREIDKFDSEGNTINELDILAFLDVVDDAIADPNCCETDCCPEDCSCNDDPPEGIETVFKDDERIKTEIVTTEKAVKEEDLPEGWKANENGEILDANGKVIGRTEYIEKDVRGNDGVNELVQSFYLNEEESKKYVNVEKWSDKNGDNNCLSRIIHNSYDLEAMGIESGSEEYRDLMKAVMDANPEIYGTEDGGWRQEVGGTGRKNAVLRPNDKVYLPEYKVDAECPCEHEEEQIPAVASLTPETDGGSIDNPTLTPEPTVPTEETTPTEPTTPTISDEPTTPTQPTVTPIKPSIDGGSTDTPTPTPTTVPTIQPTIEQTETPETEPTVPTQPTVPTESTEPTVPTQPTVPTESTEPTVPTQPTVPTESTEPTVPTQPTTPTESTEPNIPTQPTIEETATPTQEPTTPTESTEPNISDEPTLDTTPTDPSCEENQFTDVAIEEEIPTLPSFDLTPTTAPVVPTQIEELENTINEVITEIQNEQIYDTSITPPDVDDLDLGNDINVINSNLDNISKIDNINNIKDDNENIKSNNDDIIKNDNNNIFITSTDTKQNNISTNDTLITPQASDDNISAAAENKEAGDNHSNNEKNSNDSNNKKEETQKEAKEIIENIQSSIKEQAEPAQEPASAPAQEPASAPAQAPASAPAQEPASAPAQAPASAPAQEPASAPAQEPASAPAQEPASAPAQAPAQAPSNDTPSVDIYIEEDSVSL